MVMMLTKEALRKRKRLLNSHVLKYRSRDSILHYQLEQKVLISCAAGYTFDMKKVALLYGKFSKEIATLPECNPNDDRNWMGWTKKQLIELGYEVICPIIPKVWEAPYGEWKKALDEAEIDADTILVGLSAGGAACVRYIAEEKKAIKKLILVAPARYVAEKKDPLPNADEFYDFEVSGSVKQQIKNGTTIFVSNDEPLAGIQEAVKIYEKELGAKVIRFEDRGHFSFLIKTFPELVEEISVPL
jgi:predicted alpha/beta hydrolase family esterase